MKISRISISFTEHFATVLAEAYSSKYQSILKNNVRDYSDALSTSLTGLDRTSIEAFKRSGGSTPGRISSIKTRQRLSHPPTARKRSLFLWEHLPPVPSLMRKLLARYKYRLYQPELGVINNKRIRSLQLLRCRKPPCYLRSQKISLRSFFSMHRSSSVICCIFLTGTEHIHLRL